MVNPDVIFQIYRGAVPGVNRVEKRSNLQKLTKRIAQNGFSAIDYHGFPVELADAWEGLAKIASDEGLAAVASWGLDGETNGGKPFTGAAKGRLMGQVLARSDCAAGLCDAEGRYDDADEGKPGDVTDRGDVLDMGREIRKLAPTALLGTQFWYAPLSHGDIRTKPAPSGDPRDVLRGFPEDEFSQHTNWYQFQQAYLNHEQTKRVYGARRYSVVWDRMNRDRAALGPVFTSKGLNWQPGVTIQAYGWEDIPHYCVDAILTEALAGRPIVAWCDWQPSHTVMCAALAMHFLRDRGFFLKGKTAKEVVKAYQLEWNAKAPAGEALSADGLCGRRTLLTMGLHLG